MIRSAVGTLLPAIIAKEMPGGAGHVLVHSTMSKALSVIWCLLWFSSTMGLLAAGVAGHDLTADLVALVIGSPLVAVGLYALRRSLRVLEMNNERLTLRDGSQTVTILWTEVARVNTTGVSNKLAIYGSNGNRIVVDPGFVGKGTLLEYLRAHIPSLCNSTLLNDFPVDRGT